ncbi:MAG: TetR/AcrR family transcriptional regulator [Chloroflexi bacterium]|nr:TetR/AcrR family transcriptional regulator [Chloroflexota bacterium]
MSLAHEQPVRRQARAVASRDKILQAALTVFALKGYAGTSMDDICLASAVSKGGLYHHFPTKRSVLAGVVNRLAEDGALLPPFTGTAVKTVPAASLGRVLLEIWAEATRDAALRGTLKAAYEAQMDAELRSTASLTVILRIGALVQMLTRGADIDAGAAARRLGIEQAA